MSTRVPTPVTNAETMSAIVQDAYGTAPEAVLRLAEIARPTIGDDEVLVRVAAASVDMGTWHCMTGMPYAMRLAGFGVRSPKASNPGRALAGTVESVGKNVTEFMPGDEVYGSCDGSFAEYARVETSMLARQAHEPVVRAGRGRPHLGRYRAAGRPQGERAAGAEGVDRRRVGRRGHVCRADRQGLRCGSHWRVQYAKVDLVRSLGADHVIDYTRDDFAAGEHRYDVILDIGGNRRLSHLRRVLTPRGTLVIVGGETDGRWLGGFDRSLRALLLSLFVRQTLEHARLEGERQRPQRAPRPHRDRGGQAGHRPHVSAQARRRHAIQYVSEGRRPGQGRHRCVSQNPVSADLCSASIERSEFDGVCHQLVTRTRSHGLRCLPSHLGACRGRWAPGRHRLAGIRSLRTVAPTLLPRTARAWSLARMIDEWGLGAPHVVGPDVGTAVVPSLLRRPLNACRA